MNPPVDAMAEATKRARQKLQTSVSSDLYLELLKRCLTDTLDAKPPSEREKANAPFLPDPSHLRLHKEMGLLWPEFAETMVGHRRLENVRDCLECVLADGVPGDLVETGVWRGGTVIFMRAVLTVYGVGNRRVWAADSFQGLPRPTPGYYENDVDLHQHGELAVSLDQVKENFRRYGMLDDQVRFLPGWFNDTLPSAPIETIALLRLDGDMYESTMVALRSLYPKVSRGGFVIIDDYGALEVCRQAVHDFRDEHGICDEIVAVDWSGAYWRKGVPAPH